MTPGISLDDIYLDGGAHTSPESGMCLLEAVAFVLQAEDSSVPFNDHPECVSPVLAAMGRVWNDRLPDDKRQELKRYIPMLPGTANAEDDKTRAWMAANWLIRTYTPAWLREAGMDTQAEQLEALGDLTPENIPAIRPTLQAIRDQARGVRRERWLPFKEQVRAKVQAKGVQRPAADADAAADAVADATAAATATATAAAVAAADAVADATADIKLGDQNDWKIYDAVREAVEEKYEEFFVSVMPEFRAQMHASTHELYERMIAVGSGVSA